MKNYNKLHNKKIGKLFNIRSWTVIMAEKTIYWAIVKIEQMTFLFAATDEGLCYVDCQEQPFLPFKQWSQKNLPTFTIIKDVSQLNSYIKELEQYFTRKKQSFTIPIALHGTPFQVKVWQALQTIEYGQTVSYSDIAEKINKPTAVRAVATAIGVNPLLVFIPCHRIIGKDGSLTGFRAGLQMKKQLLTLEDGMESISS